MALKWGDFVPYVTSRLDRLSPEARYMAEDAIGKTDRKDAVAALQNELGMSESQAEGFLRLFRETRKQPGVDVEASRNFLGGFAPNGVMSGNLKPRNEYASDEEYQTAVLNLMGLSPDAPDQAAQDQEAAKIEGQKAGVIERLKAFATEMLGPVGDNDPVYNMLVQSGTDAAQASAAQAGLSGRSGLAGTQAASVAQQNSLPYLAQRQSQGLGALNAAGNMELGLQGLNDAEGRYRQDRLDSIAEANWKASQNQMQTALSLGGSVLGGVGGYMAGGAQGIAPGMQFGGSLAAGAGSLAGPQAPTYSTYKPPKGPRGPSGGAGY